ncbi:MAG: hypothetical protein E6344_09745 [Clostridium sp.]|nr:hypothetical protein [Clostridium sp.]MDU7083964.1 hypothetical protein [Clostridium sp.]
MEAFSCDFGESKFTLAKSKVILQKLQFGCELNVEINLSYFLLIIVCAVIRITY